MSRPLKGQVWKNLASIIAESEVDLLVVGTHGRTGLGKLLLGSVAENILRHSPCPVLTVGPKVPGRAKLPELSSRGSPMALPTWASGIRFVPWWSVVSESLQAAVTVCQTAKDRDRKSL